MRSVFTKLTKHSVFIQQMTIITSSHSGSEEIRKIPVHLQNVVNAAGKGDLRELVSCLQKLPGAAEEMHKCTASSINNECANLCSDPLKSSFGNTTKEKLQVSMLNDLIFAFTFS